MKRKKFEKGAASVARAYVQDVLGDILNGRSPHRLTVQNAPVNKLKLGTTRVVFTDLTLMGQLRHRFALWLLMAADGWVVTAVQYARFTESGKVDKNSVRYKTLPIGRQTGKVSTDRSNSSTQPKAGITKKTPTRGKSDLVYAKVVRITDSKGVLVEHYPTRRLVQIDEKQPFVCQGTLRGRPPKGTTVIRIGDTVAYQPDKTSAGNHTFVGLPKK